MIGGSAWFLLAAAVGYWVLERAYNQKKGLKTVGQVVGGLIILLSFLGFTCKTFYAAKYGRGGIYCPMSNILCPAGPKCPFMSQLPAQK